MTASYYLLLKELIKKGETSPADVRRADYDPKQFVHTAASVRREKMRDKLENASMQFDPEAEERVEEEYESSAIGLPVPLDEDGIEISGAVEPCQVSEKETRGRKK